MYRLVVSVSGTVCPAADRYALPHSAQLEKVKSQHPAARKDTVNADAGHDGEADYAYLEQHEVEAIVKYSTTVRITYHREKSQTRQKLRMKKVMYALAVRRIIKTEPVFGTSKNNRRFKGLLLRGLPKVSLEVGWRSLDRNLLKKAAVDSTKAGAKRTQST